MNKNRSEFVQVYAELGKFTISLSVSLSTLTAYVLWAGEFNKGVILPFLGVFILSLGSSAMNHYQERDLDRYMDRTRNRPLPKGKIKPSSALIYSVFMLVTGSVLLYLNSVGALALGLLTVIWYNLIYTPLKRKTAFAVVPGALIGAFPPVIGWVAAGGDIFNFKIIVVAFFFFMGQIPHFWLIMLKFGKEYEAAGFPSLSMIFQQDQIKRLTFMWIVALAVSSLLFPLTGIIINIWLIISLIIFSVGLIYSFRNMLVDPFGHFRFGIAFLHLNLYFLVLMILLVLSAISVI